MQKYQRKRHIREQRDKIFMQFEIDDIVRVNNRGAPANDIKKEHMLGHGRPSQVGS